MKKLLIAYDGSQCFDAMLEELPSGGLPLELDVTVLSVADVCLPPDPANAEPAFPDPISKSVKEAYGRAIHEVKLSRAFAQGAGARLKVLFPNWRLRAV